MVGYKQLSEKEYREYLKLYDDISPEKVEEVIKRVKIKRKR